MSVCGSGPHTCLGTAYCLISYSLFHAISAQDKMDVFSKQFPSCEGVYGLSLKVLRFLLLHLKGRGSLGEWNFKPPWSAGRGRSSAQNFLLLILEWCALWYALCRIRDVMSQTWYPTGLIRESSVSSIGSQVSLVRLNPCSTGPLYPFRKN